MTDNTCPARLAGTFSLGDRTVRRIGFGAMQLPGPGVIGPPRDHDEAVRVLRRAVELGVNHIDTAQYYGPDVSNTLIREALHPYADDLAIVSKVGARRDASGGWTAAQRPEQLREDVDANLRSLDIEQLAAVNLRRMDEHGGGDPAGTVPLEEQLGEMVALRDEGKIGGVGVSTVTFEQVNTAIDKAGIVCVQNAFSLLDQSDTPVQRGPRRRGPRAPRARRLARQRSGPRPGARDGGRNGVAEPLHSCGRDPHRRAAASPSRRHDRARLVVTRESPRERLPSVNGHRVPGGSPRAAGGPAETQRPARQRPAF